MRRIEFLRKILTSTVTLAVASSAQGIDNKSSLDHEFTFDDLFIVSNGNDKLIYPKKDTPIYNHIIKSLSDKIDYKSTTTYLPEHNLSISIKEKYRIDDLLPIKYYFECVYAKNKRYSVENGVVFRLIKNGSDRMFLDVFVSKF